MPALLGTFRGVRLRIALLAIVAGIGSGCAARYVTPGGAADISELTTSSVAERLAAVPATPLPATIACTRIQDSGYRSFSVNGVDRGRVSLVGPEDLERESDHEAFQAWQQVREVVRLPLILVPTGRDPLLALREGAATLRADVLLVYTVDTRFDVDELPIGPLGVVTLGMVPNRSAKVGSTVSVAFLDVRTGFCFGTAEGSARDDQLANAWSTQQATDDCRRRVERQAFEQALAQGGIVWSQAAEQHRERLAVGATARSRTQ